MKGFGPKVTGSAQRDAASALQAERSLDAFYTPSTVADAVVRLANLTDGERILEPSAGGGSLIGAVIRQHQALGMDRPEVVACDIDPSAFASLSAMRADGVEAHLGDFLAMSRDQLGAFDLVLANPPFIRNHDLLPARREYLRKKYGVKGAAGIWVYFLLHATSFLKPGGRIVSIVPGSVRFANYAKELVKTFEDVFAQVSVIEFRHEVDWSTSAAERGAILIAEGYLQSSKRQGRSCELVEELDLPVTTTPFGNLADISIGTVTGRNKLFLLSSHGRASADLDDINCLPIVSKTAHIRRPRITRKQLSELAKNGAKTWLLAPTRSSKKLRDYLSRVTADEIENVSWFRRRDPWWKVDTRGRCDGVLTYMHHDGPKLALVEHGILCTNTLHRVTFKSGVDSKVKWACILSVASTIGQLSAERLGRAYGGGLLKIEPAGARRLPVIIPTRMITGQERKEFSALFESNPEAARRYADRILLLPLLGEQFESTISKWENEMFSLRRIRWKTRGLGASRG